MNSIPNPSILIVDDHSIIITGIQMLLQINMPSAKTDEAYSGNMMEEKLKTQNYDLVILDINMPDTDTHNLIHSVLSKYPQLKILIFSMSPEEVYALRFLKLGIYGFLSKDSTKEELLTAIRTILSGQRFFSQKTVQLLSANLLKGKNPDNIFDKLSAREFEIMTHLVKGSSIKEISDTVKLHPSTIGTHKTRIFDKLNVKNIHELTKLAEIHKINI
jgi:two-component system, NarL family, invasion response regulator UvrY